MRILKVHNYYQQRGGEDIVFESEVELLRQHGHAVTTYTRHNRDLASMSSWKSAKATLWNPVTWRDVHALCQKHSPEIIHTHNTFPLISPAIYDLACAQRIPLVATLDNYRPLCMNGTLLRKQQSCEKCLSKDFPLPGVLYSCYRGDRKASLVAAALHWQQHRRQQWPAKINHFITPSGPAKSVYVQAGIPPDRITVKPNFVGSDIRPLASPPREVVAYVGRLSTEKGIDILLEAWRQAHLEADLWIIGDGPLRPLVERAAANDNRLTLYGELKLPEVLEKLACCACLVFPSRWSETFGRTIVEAFAVGVPVLAAKLGGPLDLIKEGKNGFFFAPGDAANLSTLLQRFWLHRDRWPDLRNQARASYEASYTPERNYQQLLDVYKQVTR